MKSLSQFLEQAHKVAKKSKSKDKTLASHDAGPPDPADDDFDPGLSTGGSMVNFGE
jgi:hypothetical protein